MNIFDAILAGAAKAQLMQAEADRDAAEDRRIEALHDQAMNEDDKPEGDDDPGYCTTCSGSGEGMYDGSRCSRCGGSGVA
jgi:DnaJ-class molecular chaperone